MSLNDAILKQHGLGFCLGLGLPVFSSCLLQPSPKKYYFGPDIVVLSCLGIASVVDGIPESAQLGGCMATSLLTLVMTAQQVFRKFPYAKEHESKIYWCASEGAACGTIAGIFMKILGVPTYGAFAANVIATYGMTNVLIHNQRAKLLGIDCF